MSFNRFNKFQLLLIRAIKELSLCNSKKRLIDIVKKYQLFLNAKQLQSKNYNDFRSLNALKSSLVLFCKQSIKEGYYVTK